MTLGNRIKRLRENKKYSQEDLAKLLNVHSVTISKWENGTQTPRTKKLRELARIFDVGGDYFSLSESNESLHERNKEDKDESLLILKWGDGNELKLPDTPEGREMMERIALALVKNSESKT